MENATNENNENIIEIEQLIMYIFLFQVALDLTFKALKKVTKFCASD